MKEQLQSVFSAAITQLKKDGVIPAEHDVRLQFERTRQKEHGDFATNVAMTLAKVARKNPRELAGLIVDALPDHPLLQKVDIAGPGFINMFVADNAKFAVLPSIFEQGDDYGLAEPNSGQRILVEFVSANPTGPLHVGHGRGAAYGDVLARVLNAAGHRVEREYYVNDAGRQMDILAVSVWIRYLQANGVHLDLPDNAYQGAYVVTMGDQLAAVHADKYLVDLETIQQACTELEPEAALDALITLAKSELSDAGFAVFFDLALNTILDDIKDDLGGFGIHYDTWFSEKSLYNGKVQAAVERLKASGDVYEKGGALWFKTTAYGDEKDRVVVRENGQPTYFASDIAYHADKLERGFDQIIDVWGSDHHGYIPRVNASLEALGYDKNKFKVLLVQFAVLYRGGEKVGMSTRSGEFVTLRELRDEIGSDAARFFYALRKSEQHMDFDLDLAKEQSNENPMYYVQYGHARLCRMLQKASEAGVSLQEIRQADFGLLSNDHESTLLTLVQRMPEVVRKAATDYEPHQISYYLKEVATAVNSYYNTSKFLKEDDSLRNAKLALCDASRQVLKNGLSILGVAAPESM